jgi:hypothetical protein
MYLWPIVPASVRILPATPQFPSTTHFTVDIAAAPIASSPVFTPDSSPLPAVEASKADGMFQAGIMSHLFYGIQSSGVTVHFLNPELNDNT